MKHLIWAAAAVGAFLVGLYLGQDPGLGISWSSQREAVDPPRQRLSGNAEPAGRDRLALPRQAPDASAGGPGRGAPEETGKLSATTWLAALDRLDRLARGGAGRAAALRARLLDFVGDTARGGEVGGALALLDAYLERNPHDPDAHMLASDLRQMQGRSEAALTPLLDLLGFADDPAVVSRARDKLALLVNAREAHLANTGDISSLIRLFEMLARRDPAFDGHRLRLARWQLRAGRVSEAEDTLAETGTAGVDPQDREDLAAEIRLARASLPLERRDGALHVHARMAGQPLTMLVDTGATTTALSRSGAARLGAKPTGRRVRVRTANGVVESEEHRIANVEIGPLRLESLNVLVLEGPLPQDVDGLLGMDVLSRFPREPWE